MPTLKQLERERNILLAKRKKELEKKNLKDEIFQLKHAKKIELAKKVGRGFAGVGKKFQRIGENYYDNVAQKSKKQNNKVKKQDLGFGSLF